MNIAHSITDLVGGTPMLELHNYARLHALTGRIIAKLEYFNPAGSVKDRVAVAMVDAAGLEAGATIIEPTSGNTGIGLAMVAAARGMRLILTMPSSMSIERRQLLAALGAEIVLTDSALGMTGAVQQAEQLRREIPRSVILGQFENPANPDIHSRQTAVEIMRDTDGEFDVFVAGVGTGGTVSGIGRVVREAGKEVVAVEPRDSPLLTTGVAGAHKLQGIGANFVPANFDPTVVDSIIQITTDEAYAAVRDVATCEGFLIGISSGAALAAARIIAQDSARRVVVLLPDSGERYLSTDLFNR